MSYYESIEQDLIRAAGILRDGKLTGHEWVHGELVPLPEGTILGKDLYAARKLLESFIAEIARLRADVAALTLANAKLDMVIEDLLTK